MGRFLSLGMTPRTQFDRSQTLRSRKVDGGSREIAGDQSMQRETTTLREGVLGVGKERTRDLLRHGDAVGG